VQITLSVYGKLQLPRRIFLIQLGKELAGTRKRILSNPSITTFFCTDPQSGKTKGRCSLRAYKN